TDKICVAAILLLVVMEIIQIIGLAAGILTASSMLPQIFKTIKEKKADEVSLKMLVVLLAGIALWIYYGIQKQDLPIIITNVFSFLVNVTMIILRIKYRR
ncbi:MAG: SemiSWEET transporter, partial [Bacteroidota bacterium]